MLQKLLYRTVLRCGCSTGAVLFCVPIWRESVVDVWRSTVKAQHRSSVMVGWWFGVDSVGVRWKCIMQSEYHLHSLLPNQPYMQSYRYRCTIVITHSSWVLLNSTITMPPQGALRELQCKSFSPLVILDLQQTYCYSYMRRRYRSAFVLSYSLLICQLGRRGPCNASCWPFLSQ